MIDRLLDVPSVSHPQRSWTSFYKALRPIVYSELFRILPRPYEGLEDLWHDIFIRFVRDPSVLRSVMPEARETYIRVATRRHALNYLRSRKRQEAAVARIPGKTTPDSVALADAEL